MFVDVEGYFLTRFPISGIDGTGIGTGGSLVVDVDGCERLPSTHSTQKMANPYLELTFGGVTKRTATQINTINPSWKTRLAFPVSKQSGDTSNSKKSDSRSLRVRVMDWSPLHEPRCIGYASCVVDIPALRAAARNAKSSWARDISSDANGGALGLTKITVPLRGTRGGVLRLSLATVVGTGVADDTSIVVSTTPRGQDSSPVGGFDPNAEEYGEYVEPSGNDASGLDESTFPIGEAYATTPEPVPLVRAADDAEYDSFQADPVSSVTSSDGNGGSSSAVHLLQLARLAKQKRDEQRMFSDTNSTLKTDLNNVQEQLSMEKELRKAELRRALVEGALFTCHTKRKPGFEPGLYRFRYLSSKKQFVWAEGSKLTTKPKLHQFVPVSLIRECVVGVDQFTLGADGDPRTMQSRDEARRAALKKKAKKKKRRFLPKHGPVGLAKKAGNNISNMLMASKKNGEHDPSRCFSIQLWKPDSVENNISDTVMGSGAAGLGLISVSIARFPNSGHTIFARTRLAKGRLTSALTVCPYIAIYETDTFRAQSQIDLELPAGGNGRSVREWCDAIESVAGENGGGTLLDDDDDDDETVMSPKGNEVGVLLPSKSVSRRSRETSRVKIVETENGQKSDDEKNAVASESTAPLKRRVSLPKHALGIGDKGPSEGTMLTIPIPPEHGGEEELGVGGEK
jgi:hypothetical protein